jgi:hypothetical protein
VVVALRCQAPDADRTRNGRGDALLAVPTPVITSQSRAAKAVASFAPPLRTGKCEMLMAASLMAALDRSQGCAVPIVSRE